MIQIIYAKYKRYISFFAHCFADLQIFCEFAGILCNCRYFAHLRIFCRFADFLQICKIILIPTLKLLQICRFFAELMISRAFADILHNCGFFADLQYICDFYVL